MRETTTWRKLIINEMKNNDDLWDNIVGMVPENTGSNVGWYNTEFCDGYGTVEGESFVVWTVNWVYFAVVYDGSEWVGSVPRSPMFAHINKFKPEHHGGG